MSNEKIIKSVLHAHAQNELSADRDDILDDYTLRTLCAYVLDHLDEPAVIDLWFAVGDRGEW